jgi:hypothetical protein
VETDLPANGTRTWKLQTGLPPSPLAWGVKIVKETGYYEVSNGLTGVRIARPVKTSKNPPAPIQGIQLRDGQWTCRGPNQLSLPAKKMGLRILEEGPLRAAVEVSYTFNRPEYVHKGKGAPPEGKKFQGGEGFYRSTITVEAGQPSVLIEEDTDMTVSYAMDLYPELQPTHGRYRGHSSTSPANGHESDGRQYRAAHQRPMLDAFVDLQYAKGQTYPGLAVWDPWARDTGWYWQLYNDKGKTPHLFGLFAGPASRALGVGASGVSVFTEPGPRAGLRVICNRLNPDTTYYPHIRYCWGVFVGQKAEDLPDPTKLPTVARQMNMHGGFNLNKAYRVQTEFADPKRGYGALFLDADANRRLIQKLRQDKGGPYGKGFYHHLFEGEPSCRELLSAWANPGSGGVKKLATEIDGTSHQLLDALVNGNGIYDASFHYWHGGLTMMRQGMLLDSLLATGHVTPASKARLKAAAALYAAVLWDDDFVPLDNYRDSGVNLGTANMPVQQTGYRDFFALLFPEHPAMQEHVAGVEARTLNTLRGIVNKYGAEMGSPHYQSASMLPTLAALMQLQNAGVATPFQSEVRLARYGEFALHVLTPPEVRFGGLRKLVSIGDGATEASEVHGVLATGFRKTNPELSARLMGAWQAMDRPHSGFFGSTVLMIDEDAPAKEPRTADGNFPGWMSVFRTGWGTPNETALWFVNGDFYRDHRHYDQGNVVLYALGAPLSIDWGSMYTPQTSGPLMHSVLLPESHTGHPWDKDRVPLKAGKPWMESTQDAYASFRTAGFASARFTGFDGQVWRRTVTMLHPQEASPIIVLEDRLEGKSADQLRVWSMNLMAEGEVETPAGRVSPPLRSTVGKGELPSAGQVFPLPPGLNRLGFRGQWLIDWDLYTLADLAQQAHVGNWSHGWHPEREMSEFKAANKKAFEERQHILRVRGTGTLTVLIVPRRKGAKPADVQLQRNGKGVAISGTNGAMIVGDSHYSYKGSDKQVLATFGPKEGKSEGLRIAGGPAELLVGEKQALLTVHGPPGKRRWTLPGDWQIQAGQEAQKLTRQGSEWEYDYAGGEPHTVTLLKK